MPVRYNGSWLDYENQTDDFDIELLIQEQVLNLQVPKKRKIKIMNGTTKKKKDKKKFF